MNIKPLFDRVVILPKEKENVTESGIIIPSSSEERPQIGTVVAIGDGTNFDGEKTEMKVRVGDEVLYTRYAGVEVKLEDKVYLILRQADLIGVFEV